MVDDGAKLFITGSDCLRIMEIGELALHWALPMSVCILHGGFKEILAILWVGGNLLTDFKVVYNPFLVFITGSKQVTCGGAGDATI